MIFIQINVGYYLTFTSSGSLTPLIIDSSNSATMTSSGISTLTDSSSNENEGVIYLKSGANLTISGDGTLYFTPYKNMAINWTSSTSSSFLKYYSLIKRSPTL